MPRLIWYLIMFGLILLAWLLSRHFKQPANSESGRSVATWTLIISIWAIAIGGDIAIALTLLPPTDHPTSLVSPSPVTVSVTPSPTPDPTPTPTPIVPVTVEDEPNDSPEDANFISVNNTINGVLNSDDDVDYYYFTISQKSSIAITFIHEYIESSNTNWIISIKSKSALLNDNKSEIIKYEVKGDQSSSTFSKVRVPAGSYFIIIEPTYSYKNTPYEFQVQAVPEDQNFESEPNNEINEAKKNNSISLNTSISGNLQTAGDVDYYHFSIDRPGVVHINFQHEYIDSDSSFWKVSLLGDNTDSIPSFSIHGSDQNVALDSFRLSPSSNGSSADYYIKIEQYNYSPMDYQFSINYEPEPNPTPNDSGSYQYDKEPNNETSQATNIDVNTLITGNIQSDSDVDYYIFSVTQDGQVTVQFDHEYSDSESIFVEVAILDANSNSNLELPSFRSKGVDSSRPAPDTIRIPAGTYFIRVKPYYYCNDPYQLQVIYSPA